MLNDFKPGDIIACAGRSGWWRFKKYSGSRVLIELAMDRNGKIPKKPKEFSTFSHWCTKITVESIKSFKESENKKWDTLMCIIDPSLIKSVQNIEEVKTPVSEPEIFSKIGPPPSLTRTK